MLKNGGSGHTGFFVRSSCYCHKSREEEKQTLDFFSFVLGAQNKKNQYVFLIKLDNISKNANVRNGIFILSS